MDHFHGQPPYRLVLVHGGPGGNGELAPVARRLAAKFGVLEPWQEAMSVNAQIEELAAVIRQDGQLPVVLLGHSWGAWLAGLVAAVYPELVARLILVASGPLEHGYADGIMATRMSRLAPEERSEVEAAMTMLSGPESPERAAAFARVGELLSRTDSFNVSADVAEKVQLRDDIYRQVWPEAAAMRKNGELLRLLAGIRCPVLAVHGDYDPHPAAGVHDPLLKILPEARWVLLSQCGHAPWRELHARDEFFRLIEAEMACLE